MTREEDFLTYTHLGGPIGAAQQSFSRRNRWPWKTWATTNCSLLGRATLYDEFLTGERKFRNSKDLEVMKSLNPLTDHDRFENFLERQRDADRRAQRKSDATYIYNH